MTNKEYERWTGIALSEDEILYRKYTTARYLSGRPHPLKAPDEIRRRIKRTHKVWHENMLRALALAETIKTEWITKLHEEENYLLNSGWKREPYEHEEYMGDHDGWVSPRRFVKQPGRYGLHGARKGDGFSRAGAISLQCNFDGHSKKCNASGPYGIPIISCSRCGASFDIGYVED